MKSGPGLTAPKKATSAMVINSPKYSMAGILTNWTGLVQVICCFLALNKLVSRSEIFFNFYG